MTQRFTSHASTLLFCIWWHDLCCRDCHGEGVIVYYPLKYKGHYFIVEGNVESGGFYG